MVCPPKIFTSALDDRSMMGVLRDWIHNVQLKCCVSHLLPGDKPNALAEPRGEEESLTKKGKKKKTVHWAEEEQLKHYFYFDLDETERGKTDLTQVRHFVM